jgi:hypothetical protein
MLLRLVFLYAIIFFLFLLLFFTSLNNGGHILKRRRKQLLERAPLTTIFPRPLNPSPTRGEFAVPQKARFPANRTRTFPPRGIVLVRAGYE